MKGYIHIDDVYRLIAGHSNYHGDNILSALTCIAEGKNVTKPITPLDKEDCSFEKMSSVTPKEKKGHWIQQSRCEGDEQPNLVCPNCGFKISWWDMGNFCAKCGMELEGGAG